VKAGEGKFRQLVKAQKFLSRCSTMERALEIFWMRGL